MGVIVKTIVIGLDNFAGVEFTYVDDDGSEIPFDFSASTRMRLVLENQRQRHTIDSNDNPNYLDWTSRPGTVRFKFGMFPGLTEGKYPATLIVYDLQHPQGQALTHAGHYKLVFEVRELEG